MKIILGSSSRWRQQLLRSAGVNFESVSPNVDETQIQDTDPVQLALRRASAKADALVAVIREPALIITSDQVVVSAGEIRDKPASVVEAREYLESYGPDRPAETVTAIVVSNTTTGHRVEEVDVARQHFRLLPPDLIERLIQEGTVFSCAGGFRIDDPAMEPYLLRRDGTEDSIIGLPLALTLRLLAEVGADP